jgi:putative ABC transport system permease protein
MKGASTFRGSGKLSAVLLTLQFGISVTALVMGIVFARNSKFQKTIDLGYARDELIVVPVSPDLFTSFRNEVRANPKIISAEGTQNHIGYGNYRRPVKDIEKQLEVDVLDIGPGYAQAMGLKLKEGRLFDELRLAADRTNGSIIVNNKFVNDFGWKDAVGRSVTLYDTTKLTVIGVVEDFYLYGVWQAVEPLMLRISGNDQYGILAVRTKTEDLPGVLEYLSSKWKSMSTNFIFGGRVQNDLMQEGININDSIMKVNIFLAVTATLLSLIGIYNLISLDTIRRTKEIGIRKIQGASIPVIMYLVSKKFLIILLISSAIGSVGGYYLSTVLMDSIWDYFVKIGPGILLSASLIMFVATLFTISFKVVRAATRNPADSLRYE